MVLNADVKNKKINSGKNSGPTNFEKFTGKNL